MKRKIERLQAIKEIVGDMHIDCQEALINELYARGYELTQATLSRDLKHLQIAKMSNGEGNYIYVLPNHNNKDLPQLTVPTLPTPPKQCSIEFSGQMAVIKTRPGHASSVAYDIDSQNPTEIIGTIAGDDTVLLVLRDGVAKKQVMMSLTRFLPELKRKS